MNHYFVERDRVMLSEVYILMNDQYITSAAIRTMDDKNSMHKELLESLREANNS